MKTKPLSADSTASPERGSCEYLFPLVDLKAQFATIKEEVLAAVTAVLESQHFIMGPEVEKLEAEVAKLIGCSFAVSCASGSDALLLALMALGVDSGDEVITTPFTFVATAGSIARLKAKPVFVDIEAETYNLDWRQLEAAITTRTKAIIPVHLFGLPAEMREIMEIARAKRLPVIEDAAQSIGSRYEGKHVGNIGTCGCFSFFPSKNLGGAGDGGMVTCNDPELADRLSVLRLHGSRRKYNYELLGVNSRLDALQAAILRVKLRHLSAWTTARQRNADRYRQLFADAGIEKFLTLPNQPHGAVHVYNQFVVRTRQRDQLREHLRNRGIPSEIYYPLPLQLQPAFAYLGYGPGALPRSETASREVLALPVFPEMTAEQQAAVVGAVAGFFAEHKQP
jgi:dTDP-4-amino-4,6-dideoxygalactose transaminase